MEPLTPDQIALVHKVRKSGRGGRMRSRTIAKLTKIPEDRIIALLGLSPRLKGEHRRSVAPNMHMVPPKISVPEVVFCERDRRLSLLPRDLTAAYLGDPLPGYSALDRRAGGQCRE